MKTVTQTVTQKTNKTMAKINFYLKGIPSQETLDQLQRSDKDLYNELVEQMRPIVCSISFDGRREIMSTQISMNLQYWDIKKQEVKSGKGAPINRKKINDTLAEKRKAIYDFIEDAFLNGIYVEKMHLHAFFKEDNLDENLDNLEAIFKKFIAEHRTANGYPVKYKTRQKYTTLKNRILQFQGDDKFIPLRINNEWVKRFRIFLQGKKLNDNSVVKHLTVLKTFKTYLSTIGIKIPAELEKLKLVEKEQIVNILEKQELELLEQFEFDNYYLSQIRDVFLFQCYTGQRYSDIETITRDCISTKAGHNVWLLSTQKTDDNLVVPLNNKAMIILERYKHLSSPLPRFTNQYFNQSLKEMAKAVKLTRIVKKVCFYNNVKKELSITLHDAISSHMARKSFISLSTQRGIPERFVRDVSGHKSERSFKRYLNLGDAHLEAILKAWD